MRRNLFWLSDEQWLLIKPHLPTDNVFYWSDLNGNGAIDLGEIFETAGDAPTDAIPISQTQCVAVDTRAGSERA